jgi:hypothetical protein
MSRIARTGLLLGPSIDRFWVQVLEAIYRQAQEAASKFCIPRSIASVPRRWRKPGG